MKVANKIALKVVEVAEKLPTLAAFQMSAVHKRRIFNEGKDESGSQRQYKSEYYKAKRRSEGRQADYIDFEVSGQLRRALSVGDANGSIAYGVNDSQRSDAKINNAELFEAQNKKHPNFITVSDADKDEVVQAQLRFFKTEVIKAINEIR